MEITSRVVSPWGGAYNMVNTNILDEKQHLLFPAKKVCELFDAYEGKNKDINCDVNFRTPYENLRRAGVITGHDTIAYNIRELKQYLYG